MKYVITKKLVSPIVLKIILRADAKFNLIKLLVLVCRVYNSEFKNCQSSCKWIGGLNMSGLYNKRHRFC